MLGSLSKLFSKAVDQPLNHILGLGGLTKYIFLIGSIATAGGVVPGVGEFFMTVFNVAATGFVPGVQVIAEQALVPAFEASANLVGAAFENPELISNAMELG